MKARLQTLPHAIAVLALFLLAAAPSDAYIVVTSPLNLDHIVQPGAKAEGFIEVMNPMETMEEIKVYQNDYLFFADGRNLYGEPGQLPRSNARWITWSPQQVSIPPGETLRIRYTVQVPDDTALRGSYWSMLMVEPVPRASPESSQSDPGKPGIGFVEHVRYAIQIATHIGATGARTLTFAQVRLAQESDRHVLSVDVQNLGERMLDVNLWVDLYDPSGKFVGKFTGGQRRTYPGTSVRFTVDLFGLEKVTYSSLIVADCGGEDVFGANVSLVLER
jgi:P pilus assembly chaperone PapD